MAAFANVMVGHLHRNCLPFLEGVLNDDVVLLEVEDKSFCHVDKPAYYLL